MYFEAQAMTKDKAPPGAAAMAILGQAQKHFAAIAESDSNLAEKAKAVNVNISVMKLGDKTAAADLKDFENCYLKAQVERLKVRNITAAIAGRARPRTRRNWRPSGNSISGNS